MKVGLVVGPWGMDAEAFLGAIKDAERLGFSSFYVGDHFFVGPFLDSYDPYLLMALAARETRTITFGPLVTPVMFREPWIVGRWAAQIDLLSGGRFVMGLGVGWQEAEHAAYGIPYPPLRERFDRLEEMILLMKQMWQPGPGQFAGKYYQLNGPDTLPKPAEGRPPILIGGGGERRTLKLVARYGSEWSAPGLSPDELRRKLEVLAGHCEHVGRNPAEIRCSMLSMGPIGATATEIDAATQQQMERTPPATEMSLADYRAVLKERGGIVGGVEEIVDSLGRLAEAGVNEALFVYAPGVPEFLASEVLAKAAAL